MLDLVIVGYVFTAGMCLGQLVMYGKPREASELAWIIGIVLATTLWPIFVSVGLVLKHCEKRRAAR
jgi:hypothetical protein